MDAPAGPRGHYLANEVGQLAGVSGQTIGQWARRQYIQASQKPRGYPHVYAYQDIAEAMVVHELLEKGVALRYIKRALRALREEAGTEWPLQGAEIMVPSQTPEQAKRLHGRGRTVGVRRDGHVFDLVKGHAVLAESDLVAIAADLRRGGWAVRELRETKNYDLQHIEVNPARLSGRPVIRGKRVAAEKVAEVAAEKDGPSWLRSGFHLTNEEIEDAIEWWKIVQAFEVSVP